ncbi:MAG TPA: hypothetical protein VNZ45_18660 [Bacteroidia bacterium]|jgi:hypothetical protein|nr:hypothetical protein [Bacteroidia bacterium]
MKKFILTASLAFCAFGLFAQTPASSSLMSKKGEMILPEAGDWCISFDAAPFLYYAGNFFNGNTNNIAPTASFINSSNLTLVGKYFVDEQTAYRGILRIGFQSNSFTHYTPQQGIAATNPPQPTVTDKLSVASHFIGLGAGMEKRKGKTRLQGYYGAELMFWLAGNGDSTMTYGNAYNNPATPSVATVTAPVFWNWATNSYSSYSAAGGSRTISNTPGSVFGLAVQAFIGFDYFILPKISIGAEYTWGVSFWSQADGSQVSEIVYTSITAPNPNVDANITTKTGGGSHFGIDTGVNSFFGASNAGSASLNINFHF